MISLRFVNRTANDEVAIMCDVSSLRVILRWYGAFNAGDDYDAFRDGEKLNLDINGELIDA